MSGAAATQAWLGDGVRATGLWGVGMFVAALCTKQFGLSVGVAALSQRLGDLLTALLFVGPRHLRPSVLRTESTAGSAPATATVAFPALASR